jgi:3-hydroxyisobutyryl-CoA hydrolase
MRLGSGWSISETFQREHQMASKFMKHPDFTEGVSALLIRKPAPGEPKQPPKWQPATLEDIKPEDNIADQFFEVEGQRLKLLSNGDYTVYPHAKFSLPTEAAVEQLVRRGEKSPRAVVDYFVAMTSGKQGVKEVVKEIVDRKTKKEDGMAVWVDIR